MTALPPVAPLTDRERDYIDTCPRDLLHVAHVTWTQHGDRVWTPAMEQHRAFRQRTQRYTAHVNYRRVR